MCIINGGVKVSLKGKGRLRKLTRYECKAKNCGRLWGLTPNALYLTGRGPIFDGYDNKGRKQWRREGHCGCGTAFDYPVVNVNE